MDDAMWETRCYYVCSNPCQVFLTGYLRHMVQEIDHGCLDKQRRSNFPDIEAIAYLRPGRKTISRQREYSES